MDEELVRRCFKLNSYEAKTWTVLLQGGDVKIADIATMAKIPKSRIYDTLASLKMKGMIKDYSLNPFKYELSPPEIVIETVKASILTKAQNEYNNVEKAKVLVMNELNTVYKIGIDFKKIEEQKAKQQKELQKEQSNSIQKTWQ